MKKRLIKKIVVAMMLIIQILQISGNLLKVEANIKEGDTVVLEGNHECDSLVEYWMEDYQKWSYKIVYYVYYQDKDSNEKYPAFCVEPKKEGIGTGYEQYEALIRPETDNQIWRILNKGYMGSNYQEWNLECDDDFYSATKIALHSLKEGIQPKDKYILGNRSVDGNSVEDIQRRAEKTLNVAQSLYEYGISGNDKYVSPKVSIKEKEECKKEEINNEIYYVQNYTVTGNKTLKSYEVEIQNFPKGTQILDIYNQEKNVLSNNSFKIAIPINEIKENINGTIHINNAYIKTNPVYYCESSIEEAQSYVTYTSGYELAETSTNLEIEANTCNLLITKIDKETQEKLSDVTFAVFNEKGEKIGEITTNENGEAMLNNLYPRMVTIKEIKVPDKYILSNEEKKVELKLEETTDVVFENELKKGTLKIIKVDKNNNEIKLDGVKFEIYDSEEKLVDTIVTNKDGEAITKQLPIGKYTVKEIETNSEYVLNNENIEAIVEYEKTVEIKVENEKIKGKVKILKISEDNNSRNGKPKSSPIENVVFEIKTQEGKLVDTIKTNKQGIALSKELEKGKYIIKEIKTNKDYILNEQEIIVEILENKKQEEIIVTNKSKDPEKPVEPEIVKLPRTGF